MLRHIISVSLAMTACATLIPTKVNAATLGFYPANREIVAKPGDILNFTFVLSIDEDSEYVTPKSLAPGWDSAELSVFTELQWLVSPGRSISYKGSANSVIDIARMSFKVEKPLKDTRRDVWGTLTYDDANKPRMEVISDLKAYGEGPDVVPVPEPLTMFGTALGLGCGVLFKRKSSKK